MHIVYKPSFVNYIDFHAEYNKFFNIELVCCRYHYLAMHLNEFLDPKFLINKQTNQLFKIDIRELTGNVIREIKIDDMYYYELFTLNTLPEELQSLLTQYHVIKFTEY